MEREIEKKIERKREREQNDFGDSCERIGRWGLRKENERDWRRCGGKRRGKRSTVSWNVGVRWWRGGLSQGWKRVGGGSENGKVGGTTAFLKIRVGAHLLRCETKAGEKVDYEGWKETTTAGWRETRRGCEMRWGKDTVRCGERKDYESNWYSFMSRSYFPLSSSNWVAYSSFSSLFFYPRIIYLSATSYITGYVLTTKDHYIIYFHTFGTHSHRFVSISFFSSFDRFIRYWKYFLRYEGKCQYRHLQYRRERREDLLRFLASGLLRSARSMLKRAITIRLGIIDVEYYSR